MIRNIVIMSLIYLSLGCVSSTTQVVSEKNSIQYLNSGKILPSNLPFSEAVRVDNSLILSGQLGVIPGQLKLIAGGIKAESKQAMENIKLVLNTHGFKMKHLVKCTVMLADISEWADFNEVYKTFFSSRFPARSAFATNGLALNARVEVECMAIK